MLILSDKTPHMNAHDFELVLLNGSKISLKDFAGKKILLVNTASACGLTPQYAQLQELHEQFKDKVVVVGLPCNDFAGQEPGSAQEITDFCSLNYQVSFPLTDKVCIKGDDVHPLYQWLTHKSLNRYADSEVTWNFQKYLIDEHGELQAVFSPVTEVFQEEVLSAMGISL
jgi:glutathione peroxidase